MKNIEIRTLAKENKICLWQICERYPSKKCPTCESVFSRKLRYDLDPIEKEKIIKIINELKEEKSNGC